MSGWWYLDLSVPARDPGPTANYKSRLRTVLAVSVGSFTSGAACHGNSTWPGRACAHRRPRNPDCFRISCRAEPLAAWGGRVSLGAKGFACGPASVDVAPAGGSWNHLPHHAPAQAQYAAYRVWPRRDADRRINSILQPHCGIFTHVWVAQSPALHEIPLATCAEPLPVLA